MNVRATTHIVLLLFGLTQAAAGQPVGDPVARLKSCSELEPEARVACIDALLKDLSSSDPAPSSSLPKWIVSETTSPVDYASQVTAVLSSEAASEDAPSSLSIRCRAGRTELFLSTKGSWPAIKTGEVQVAYQIDAAPAVQQRWVVSQASSIAHFRGDVVTFLLSLPASARLSIRVTHGRGTSKEAVFHLQGLEDVRRKLAAACQWKS